MQILKSGPHMKNSKSTKIIWQGKLFFWWWNFLHGTHNSNTENLQHSQRYTSVPTQNTTNYNTKNKFQVHVYIKQHIWQCKENEECTKSEVPYVTFINEMKLNYHTDTPVCQSISQCNGPYLVWWECWRCCQTAARTSSRQANFHCTLDTKLHVSLNHFVQQAIHITFVNFIQPQYVLPLTTTSKSLAIHSNLTPLHFLHHYISSVPKTILFNTNFTHFQ